jgi:hypothetical protein
MTAAPLRVFVGWDSREDIAYRVCRHSILRRASVPVSVIPLKRSGLRDRGLYTRGEDPLASTEFTYTRFFVPYLMEYRGWALFCDCDFLWLADVAELFALADDRFAVMCVQHDHRPSETWKMDNKKQSVYPRKNWSSMVLYNCGHPKNRALTPELISRETGSFLHRFLWLEDSEIGGVPETWNWLEGWCQKPADGPPKAIHYARGGPWFEAWRDVDYAALWLAECASLDSVEAGVG